MCLCLSRDIRPNQLEHTLLKVPILSFQSLDSPTALKVAWVTIQSCVDQTFGTQNNLKNIVLVSTLFDKKKNILIDPYIKFIYQKLYSNIFRFFIQRFLIIKIFHLITSLKLQIIKTNIQLLPFRFRICPSRRWDKFLF